MANYQSIISFFKTNKHRVPIIYSATQPSSPTTGDLWMDAAGSLTRWNGSAWASFGGALGITTMKRVYENTLSAAATTVTIPSLAGNTAKVWQLRVYTVFAVNSTVVGLRFNADSGNNYGAQDVKGTSTTAQASRESGVSRIPLQFSGATASGRVAYSVVDIFALAGARRLCVMLTNDDATGVTIITAGSRTGIWDNTGSEITSIDIFANQTDGLGIGTRIELWEPTAV